MSALPLGQHTTYPDLYQPELLYPIKRPFQKRINQAGIPAHWKNGVDYWRAYEVSWLDATGKPTNAVIQISYSADSPFMVESKSFKLYLNSLNFKHFTDLHQLTHTIQTDLESVLQTQVIVQESLNKGLDTPSGYCIDQENFQKDLALKLSDEPLTVEDTIYTNLFRSNCPVTSQPDWATLLIRYIGLKWNYEALLSYLVSFRKHNGFHEDCAEQIYNHLWEKLHPKDLMIYAAFTRRGGVDINPCRSSRADWVPAYPLRFFRQ